NSPPLDAPSPFGHGHAMIPGMPGSAVAAGMPTPMMGTGNLGVPTMGQTLSPYQIPNAPALANNPTAGKVTDSAPLNSQSTTEIISTDQQPPKHRGWWHFTGSNN